MIAASHGHVEPLALQCPPGLKHLKVLVVDDEADSRDLLAILLEQCQAEVRTAGSAAAALALLDDFSPDVIVSDIGMPDMDGYHFIAEVRRRSPDRGGCVPAIALTAFSRSEDRTRAFVSGFQVHVPKPAAPIELLAAVAALASVHPRPA